MTPFEIHALAGLVAALAALAHVVINRPAHGNASLAAWLGGAFLSFSLVTIWQEGLVLVWTNHTANLWGVQVWWDLLIAVVIALFLIAPRARAAGMNVPLWTLLVAATASIGLLAMCARLFVLERRAPSEGAR
jgi:hypothetical protein